MFNLRSAIFTLIAIFLSATGLTSLIDLFADGDPISDILSSSAGVFGLSVAGVLFGILLLVVIVISTVRGRHPWQTDRLAISITYLTEDGSRAVSQRKQVFSPNHEQVKGVITSVTTTGIVRERDWTLTEPAGKQVQPERSLLDAATYKAICFVCPNDQFLPYPWWGILAPQSLVAKHYSITLDGEIQYENSWTADIENFDCDPVGPIKELVITVQVPSSRIKEEKCFVMALLSKADNSIVSKSSFPFRKAGKSTESGLEIHVSTVSFTSLKPDESVFLEWELNPL